MNYTVSEEDYIKAIFHLGGTKRLVGTNHLSEELKTRPASVTDMLKKLQSKNLVHYEPYQGAMLNAEGKKLALSIVRRHRLWECFLAEKLQFSWDEVHEMAEELEHVSSQKLIDKLDAYLGYPEVDPHGDPIPDKKGKMKLSEQFPLTELPVNNIAVVKSVSNQSSEMLTLLHQRNILIGTQLEVKRVFEFDHSIEIKIGNMPVFTITEQLARNIFVIYE